MSLPFSWAACTSASMPAGTPAASAASVSSSVRWNSVIDRCRTTSVRGRPSIRSAPGFQTRMTPSRSVPMIDCSVTASMTLVIVRARARSMRVATSSSSARVCICACSASPSASGRCIYPAWRASVRRSWEMTCAGEAGSVMPPGPLRRPRGGQRPSGQLPAAERRRPTRTGEDGAVLRWVSAGGSVGRPRGRAALHRLLGVLGLALDVLGGGLPLLLHRLGGVLGGGLHRLDGVLGGGLELLAHLLRRLLGRLQQRVLVLPDRLLGLRGQLLLLLGGRQQARHQPADAERDQPGGQGVALRLER